MVLNPRVHILLSSITNHTRYDLNVTELLSRLGSKSEPAHSVLAARETPANVATQRLGARCNENKELFR
jgi:hypothetical protein